MTKRLRRYTRKNKARKSRRNTHRRKLRNKKRNYTKRQFFIKRGGGGGGGEINPYKLYAQTTFNDSSQYNAGSAANHVMTMVGDGPTQKHFSFISAYN